VRGLALEGRGSGKARGANPTADAARLGKNSPRGTGPRYSQPLWLELRRRAARLLGRTAIERRGRQRRAGIREAALREDEELAARTGLPAARAERARRHDVPVVERLCVEVEKEVAILEVASLVMADDDVGVHEPLVPPAVVITEEPPAIGQHHVESAAVVEPGELAVQPVPIRLGRELTVRSSSSIRWQKIHSESVSPIGRKRPSGSLAKSHKVPLCAKQ